MLFSDECQTKYGNANAWRYCCKVFDLLTVAAVSKHFFIYYGVSEWTGTNVVSWTFIELDMTVGARSAILMQTQAGF